MLEHVTAKECEEAYNRRVDLAIECSISLSDYYKYLMKSVIERCKKELEATND